MSNNNSDNYSNIEYEGEEGSGEGSYSTNNQEEVPSNDNPSGDYNYQSDGLAEREEESIFAGIYEGGEYRIESEDQLNDGSFGGLGSNIMVEGRAVEFSIRCEVEADYGESNENDFNQDAQNEAQKVIELLSDDEEYIDQQVEKINQEENENDKNSVLNINDNQNETQDSQGLDSELETSEDEEYIQNEIEEEEDNYSNIEEEFSDDEEETQVESNEEPALSDEEYHSNEEPVSNSENYLSGEESNYNNEESPSIEKSSFPEELFRPGEESNYNDKNYPNEQENKTLSFGGKNEELNIQNPELIKERELIEKYFSINETSIETQRLLPSVQVDHASQIKPPEISSRDYLKSIIECPHLDPIIKNRLIHMGINNDIIEAPDYTIEDMIKDRNTMLNDDRVKYVRRKREYYDSFESSTNPMKRRIWEKENGIFWIDGKQVDELTYYWHMKKDEPEEF